MKAEGAHERRAPRVAGAGLLIATTALAVNLTALSGGFVYDDLDNVLRNPWVREPGRLAEAFTHHMAAFAPGYDTSYYRPLMHVILAAAHRLFGVDPWGHHLLLVLLHVACCVSVFALLVRFAQGPAGEGGTPGPPHGALLGALLFAVHPIHVEAVAWVSGVVDLSCSLLVVLALLASTSAQAWPRLLVAPPLFFAALLGKEPAVMLLPVFAIFAIASGDLREPARRPGLLATGVGLGGALALYLGLRVAALGGLMGSGGSNRVPVGLLEGVLTALALFGEYVGLLLVPLRQTVVHDFPVVNGLTDVRAWLGIAACSALGVLAWRVRRSPGALLGLGLLVLPLLPALYVPVLGEGLVGERYLYLPSVGLALLIALGWDALARRGRALPWTRAAAGAALGVTLLGAATTVNRNRVWHDDVTLWANAARNAPRSPGAHEGLGYALLVGGQPAEAVRSLARAVELDPKRRDARTNLASALAMLGRTDEAIEQARTVLAESPGKAEAHALLGRAFADQGRLPEAVTEYLRAVEHGPRVASFHNGLAMALARLGEVKAAEVHFREAIRLDPRNAAYANNLGALEQGPAQDAGEGTDGAGRGSHRR